MIERLRGVGYRMTAQRRAVLDAVLALPGHFTIERVNEGVGGRVDLSTIYRTVEMLSALGVLQALVGSSPVEYEVAHEPHHHLICDGCGHVTVVADHHFDALMEHLSTEHGFEADLTHLAIPGRCADCAGSLTAAQGAN